MNANELAEDLEGAKLVILKLNHMLRQQQSEIKALKEYMEAQDKHIVNLAFKLVYAERGNEIAKELSK